MHVLIVARTFPPAASIGARRVFRMAEALADQGQRVSVLTQPPQFYEAVDPSLAERPPEVRILYASPWEPTAWLRSAPAAIGPNQVRAQAPAAPRASREHARSPQPEALSGPSRAR